MIFAVLIAQFELAAHTGFLQCSFIFVELFEVSEVARTRLISTLENSVGIS